MKRLWFVMPVHGRFDLTKICLEQLRRTCDALEHINATAVIVGDDDNLDVARGFGFATVERDNTFLARKFNDGIQLALDPGLNPEPADYVVPIGSDDWVDHRIFQKLPPNDSVMGFRQAAFVNETGTELTETRISYVAGVGIRVYPRELLEPAGFRPADEDRKRACDTSILYNTRRAYMIEHQKEIGVVYGDRHPCQIVDWKTTGEQMNTHQQIVSVHRGVSRGDPFTALDGVYPQEALEAMQEHYG
jgi:hypothetical protein